MQAKQQRRLRPPCWTTLGRALAANGRVRHLYPRPHVAPAPAGWQGRPFASLPGARCCSKHRLQPWNWPRKAVLLRVHVSYSLGSVRT